MSLQVGMIGLGTVARDHLLALSINPSTELRAVCDIDSERVREVAADYDAAGYTDYEQMLDSESLDWVHVCTPVQSHFEIASDVLNAGIDTLVEKPITQTLDDYEELASISDENGVRLTQVHTDLYHYEIRQLRKRVENGEVGDVKSVEVYFGEELLPDEPERGDWVLDLAGGELEEGFPHPIYIALRLAGYPEDEADVNVSTALKNEYEEDIEYDGVAVSFDSGQEVLCSIHIQSDVPNDKTVRVHGTRGTIEADVTYHSMLTHPTNDEGRFLHEPLSAIQRDGYRILDAGKNLVNTGILYLNELFYYRYGREAAPHLGKVGVALGTMNRQMYHLIDAEAKSIIDGTPSPIPHKEIWWTMAIINKINDHE